jgi:hypothetical protein
MNQPVKGYSGAGGGFMGIGPCRYVSDLEKATGKWIQDLFDFFAGTSVEAIDAGMYACGFHGQDTLDMHHAHGAAIFGKRNLRYRLTKCGPQYDSKVIDALLKEKCGDRTMAETVKPLYLTAWDMRRKQLKVFGPKDKDVPVWFAIRCSMAATTFFSTPDGRHGDGGFAANDPLLVGFAGVVMGDDALDTSNGMKLLNMVTSGLNPEGPAVGNDWFILTYLKQIVLKAITTGNSADVEFIRGAIDKWTVDAVTATLRKLVESGAVVIPKGTVEQVLEGNYPRLLNFRVNPPCTDYQLDETQHAADVEAIWAECFKQDKDELLAYLADPQ